MANIILTNSCNIKCPFCFASENSGQSLTFFDPLKSWRISSFIVNDFRFCGGEPTLTPDITDIAEAILDSGKNILIMTNGIWPEPFHDFIKNLPDEYQIRISYLFNLLHPSFYRENEFQKILSSLSLVNPLMTTLGLTVYKADFDYQYLLDLAKEYRIKRLRWSVAAPNISNQIDLLEPSFYKISNRLCEMYDLCNQMDILVISDCNYIQPCYFQKQQLPELLINNNLKFGCSGGSPVDIDPDGMAWRCFGLYSILKKNIKDFTNEQQLERYFTRRIRLLNNMPAYKECLDCSYWKKGCDGGCFVYRIKKAFKQNSSLNLFPIDDDSHILQCKPYRSKNLVLKEEGNMTKLYFGNELIINEDENTLAFLKEVNGKYSINDLIELWKNDFSSYENAVKAVKEKCRELFEKDYILINYDYGIEPEERPKTQI